MKLLDKPATQLEGFDLQRYLEQGTFRYHLGGKIKITIDLRLRRQTALHLLETPLSRDQRVEPFSRDDEWVRLHAAVANTHQLRWWLLGLGDQMIVEGPAELRSTVTATLRAAAQRYSDL